MKTENKKCVVGNIIGGPGTGKTILAADVFSKLKRSGVTCDVSWEYIKRKLRENAMKVVQNQAYIFGKQQFQLFSLKDEVEVIITDSPLLLNPIYDKSKCLNLKNLVLEEYNKYNNLLYFVERDTNFDYETEGRYQDLEGAKKVDSIILNFLNDNNIEYKVLKGIGQDTIDTIYADIMKELKK